MCLIVFRLLFAKIALYCRRVKYDREQSISGSEHLFLSTLFPTDKPLLKGSNWDVLMSEFLALINLKR